MNRAPLFWAGVSFLAVAIAYSRKASASTGGGPDATPGLDLFGGLFIPEINIQAQSRAANILAQTAWGEARGQGLAGMQAVINSVMNRAAVSARTVTVDWWGETVEQICTMSKVKNGIRYYQYAAWDPAGPNLAQMRAVTPDDVNYAIALDLAVRALRGELPDVTGGATHYYANYISAPEWTLGATQTAQFGRHVFFKNVA